MIKKRSRGGHWLGGRGGQERNLRSLCLGKRRRKGAHGEKGDKAREYPKKKADGKGGLQGY